MRDLVDNLVPAELVDAAMTRDVGGFLTLYGDTLLLLIRLRDGDVEMSTGLGATAVRGSAGMRVKPVLGSMEFNTVLQPLSIMSEMARPRPREEQAGDVTRRLEDAPHFAVPLRKRADADALYVERISVGRARNKDIVLRHQSVSKFHAWFEVDEAGAFQVTDAGSKNGTWVNGESIPARERTPLAPGDTIRFGSVETILCSPRTVWTAARQLRR